jgi:peptidoglycan/xylan/chitin deacetylase (PgdA/CDA1 family)
MRKLLKGMAEGLLCEVGTAAFFRRLHGRDTLILAYHNIVPEGEASVGDSSLHLLQRNFAAQLDLLARTHDVVPLAEALEARRAGRRPRVVVTFDDAYEGAVVAGATELVRRGLPATFFVAPGYVGGGSFWWDVIAERGGGPVSEASRARALDALQGRGERVRAWATGAGLTVREVPRHQTVASEAQLRALPADLIGLGSHSWSHPNLAALSAEEVSTELSQPLAWLRERFTNVIPWVAYPYGLSSPAVEAAAREAGYEGGLRVSGGWHRAGETVSRYAMPRHNIPAGLSRNGFELLVSGVTG